MLTTLLLRRPPKTKGAPVECYNRYMPLPFLPCLNIFFFFFLFSFFFFLFSFFLFPFSFFPFSFLALGLFLSQIQGKRGVKAMLGIIIIRLLVPFSDFYSVLASVASSIR